MSTPAQARAIALALPGAQERDHHGRPSFRVGGRIFATMWDSEHMNVMLDEPGIRTYAAREGDVFEAVQWGKRLAAVRVRLAGIEADELRDLLTDAWEGKAPAALRLAPSLSSGRALAGALQRGAGERGDDADRCGGEQRRDDAATRQEQCDRGGRQQSELPGL